MIESGAFVQCYAEAGKAWAKFISRVEADVKTYFYWPRFERAQDFRHFACE